MFTNALRCPGCGESGWVEGMYESGGLYVWSFHCTAKCGDRWYHVHDMVAP